MNATSDSDCMSCGGEGRRGKGRGGEGRRGKGRGGEEKGERGGEGKGEAKGKGRGGVDSEVQLLVVNEE